LQLNGVSQFVTIPDTSELHLSAAATVELWVRPLSPVTSLQRLVNKGDGADCGSNRAYELNLHPPGSEFGSAVVGDLFTGSDCNGWLSIDTEREFVDSQWFHVAITHNATLSRHRLFINGAMVNERTLSMTGEPASSEIRPAAGWPLLLGGATPNSLLMHGQLDEVRIWNIERSPAEIGQHYNLIVPTDSAGLAAYYQFDEPVTSQLVQDSTEPASSGVLGSDEAVAFDDPARVDSTAPIRGCQADSNGDGAVDAADLSVMLGTFGQSVPLNSSGDLNANGLVNAADLSVLLGSFGSMCDT